MDASNWRELSEKYPQIFDDLWLFPKRGEGGDTEFHGAFIPQVVEYLVLRYTGEGDTVLDPFAGSGTTIDVCSRLDRKCLACDLVPYREDIQTGNAKWTEFPESDLVILHPPYYNIIQFSDNINDLSNADDLDDYLGQMCQVIQNVSHSLRTGGWLALVIGDYYRDGELTLLSYKCCQLFLDYGYTLKVDYIKDMQGNSQDNTANLWKYRHLRNGTAVFKHEHIFVFRK